MFWQCRHLTQALLQKDFSLNVRLPPNRLCPPIPNRLNYVLWINDIIDPFHSASAVPVKGVDMSVSTHFEKFAADALSAEQELRVSTHSWDAEFPRRGASLRQVGS